MITQILLAVVVILLVILIFLVIKGRSVKPRDIENAVSSTWTKLGLDEKIGKLAIHAQDIRDSHRSIEQMLRVPTERAALGEMSLETILSDQLPPDMFGIRKMILDGKIPDAHIRSTVGLICIDSKFPLDNYRKMAEVEDSKEKEDFKNDFRKDVRSHLNKIAEDYVCPEKGSAEFAFAYIPSEAVYYFLVNEEFEMLRDYTKRGVQVVSPLTLSHKIELIKAGVHAKKLSEEAESVRKDLNIISQRFYEIDELWRVFYSTHLRNAGERAEELDIAYKRLREEFDKISRMSKE
ncbi:MAG: DNA recombination protein RmuC [Dehalococcoidia bacterium]|nr:DNA recombination protein RmuC [Dehalococcoidia bacterium]